MTKLLHPVRRESGVYYQTRPIVLQIEPPGILALKEKGRHHWYYLPLGVAYHMAVRAAADAKRRERRAAKKGRCHAVPTGNPQP